MSTNYSLTITNNALEPNYFMMFQQDPTTLATDAMVLAWFSKYSIPGPNVTVQFDWTIDWGFSWSQTGPLAVGVTYIANDQADSTNGNMITLDYDQAYEFVGQTAGQDPSNLYINETGNIPVDPSLAASVGITMSGSTVYATQAIPNTNLTISPKPQYWLAYGNYSQGQVVDVSTVNNPIELTYGLGISSLFVTLNDDNSWSPTQSLADRNRAFLAASRKDPKVAWARV